MKEKEWSPKDVIKTIETCKANKGTPMFRTRNETDVTAICYNDDHDKVESIRFTAVPKDIHNTLKKSNEDWKWLIRKFGNKRQKEILGV